MLRSTVVVAIAMLAASPAFGQSADKSVYSLNPTPATALRDLSTDRPDKTESPYTVDAGRFQIEMDFVVYSSDLDRSAGSAIRSETVAVAPLNLKVGLTASTDLQLLVAPYVQQTVIDRASGVRERVSGFGDVTLRLKHNLWGNDGGRTATAVMPFVKLPTSSDGLGNGAVEFGLIVPLAIGVSDRVGIGLMTEIDMIEEDDENGYAANFINSAALGFDVTDRLGVYTELFAERSTDRGARWIVTGDMGLTYALSDDLQLDGGVNLGISRAADDVEVFVGISRRF